MPLREYICAECGGTFVYEYTRGRPRVSCEGCAPGRARRQIDDWGKAQTSEQRRAAYERNREAIIERATVWNAEHPERRSQINRKYSAQPEVKVKRAESQRRWNAANPDKLRAYAKRYKQWQRRLLDLDDEGYGYAMVLVDDPCSYCGESGGEVDHIVPVSRGGANHWTNLTAACRSCNAKKHAKSLALYLRETGC